ncbi:mannonate dehydratase [Pelagibacterium xiamenense]|uniref:mannonate dehydratase n=1 Tax=Pelagibacterium xiamenense TaxID=2901140 RepID=UPI001E3A6704|nr:mannonate dehydratase [Pelagibacterium xiamenense]MCD7058611.1 mannonate dehydratase [Pelagibacterium xiamenense]
MRQTWRWFGPDDPVSLSDMLQAGVEGVVTALHHLAPGAVWSANDILRRKAEIAYLPDGTTTGLTWDVVESLPVSEAIKTQTGPWREHIAAYKKSLENLGASGIGVVCYNFMPVLDWTRTDLAFRLPHGGTAMRFDIADFAAFDIHILARPGAAEDFAPEVVAEAAARFARMDAAAQDALTGRIVAGLPGAAERRSLADVRALLASYDGIGPDTLRAHLADFLAEVVPVAERAGVRMCCHPDDPPFVLLGLPRVVSTAADCRALLAAVDTQANGITLCSGSLGARADNDLVAMMEEFGPRVHFLHLRNVKRETGALTGSFYEAEHLGGDTDMVGLVRAVLAEEARRRAAGRSDASIPFRPDHGQAILDDLSKQSTPGYPAIGRLRGLAELRGVVAGLSYPAAG